MLSRIIKKPVIQFLFYNPYLIAVIPSVIIIVFLLPKPGKFKVNLDYEGMTNKLDCIEIYEDIDGDKYSELIIVFDHDKQYSSVKMENDSGGLAGWWTFRGKYQRTMPAFNDYDSNGYKELYFLAHAGDSVLLHILDFNPVSTSIMRTVFIDRINHKTGRMDFSVSGIDFCDIQQDGYLECCFSILGGFALKPRRLYLYDYQNDSVSKGPDLDCYNLPQPVNIDDDPYPEFVNHSSSLNNMTDWQPGIYHDHSAWLMPLDHEFGELFDPVEFPGHKSTITTIPLVNGDSTNLLVLFDFYGDQYVDPMLFLYDLKGRLIRKKVLHKPLKTYHYAWINNPVDPTVEAYLYDKSGAIYSVNSKLDLNLAINLGYEEPDLDAVLDLDNDGAEEYIFSLPDGESFLILQDNLKDPVQLKTDFYSGQTWISALKRGSENPELVIVRGEKKYIFAYSMDRMYYMQYPVWLGIYLIFVFFIKAVGRLQKMQLDKARAISDKIAGLQLAGINNQMNPHFTMNIMNTISSFIYREEKQKAYDFFIAYTRLIRSTLEMSDRISRSLGEELEFVENYVKLEQMRRESTFSYHVLKEENVNLSLQVPKMIIQLHVENAIKYGLGDPEKDGSIWINVSRPDSYVEIRVGDNGPGINATIGTQQGSTRKGYIIMDRMIDLYSRLMGDHIEYDVIDLSTENPEKSGTEVRIRIKG